MMKYIFVKVLFLCFFVQIAQAAYPTSTAKEPPLVLTHELPLLTEIISNGLQEISAVRSAHGDLPKFIRTARYGYGMGSFVTLANHSDAPWASQIVIDDVYFGVQNYLFANINGTPVSQNMNGRTTIISVEIPARETIILSAIAEVSRFAQGAATVSWKDDGAKGRLTIESPITPSKVAAPRAGWIQISHHDGNVWNFDSAYFDSPIKDIQAFPFYGGVKDALIVLPTEPSPEESWAAKQIQRYFQDWGKDGIKPAQKITLQIIRGLAPRQKDQPLVYVAESLRKVHTKGLVFQVGKSEDVSIKEATIQLLNALGEKYFYRTTTD